MAACGGRADDDARGDTGRPSPRPSTSQQDEGGPTRSPATVGAEPSPTRIDGTTYRKVDEGSVGQDWNYRHVEQETINYDAGRTVGTLDVVRRDGRRDPSDRVVHDDVHVMTMPAPGGRTSWKDVSSILYEVDGKEVSRMPVQGNGPVAPNTERSFHEFIECGGKERFGKLGPNIEDGRHTLTVTTSFTDGSPAEKSEATFKTKGQRCSGIEPGGF